MPREHSDFRVKYAILAGASLAVLVAVVLALIHALTLSQAPKGRDEAAVPALSPIGEAEFEAGDQLKAFRSAELQKLHSYGWVEKGVAHIPIERAMELER